MGQADINRTSMLPLLLSLSTFAINLVFCTTTEISINESSESQSTTSLPLTSSAHLLLNSVKIVDFVQLRENKREAEFIIDLVQEWNTTSTEQIATPAEIEFVKFRDVETLRVLTSLRNGVGKIFRKVKVVVPCHMKYTLYPHDSHECDLEMVQNQNQTEYEGFQVIWKWVSPYSMPVCGPLETYDFRVIGYLSTNMEGIDSALDELKNDKQIPESVGADNDNKLSVRLIVERTSTKQIFSAMYVPALCITILSFFTLVEVSFPLRIATSVAFFLGLAIFEALFWPNFPRGDAGDVSAIENYLAFCLGFVFQVVLTNVLLRIYLRNGDNKSPTKTISDATLEIEEGGGKDVTNEESSFSGILCCKTDREKDKEQKVIPEEEHIMKKGKCHRFFYFRTLKPAHKQLPVWFFIFNVVYFTLVLGYSGGLPTGFQNSPTKDDPNFCFQ